MCMRSAVSRQRSSTRAYKRSPRPAWGRNGGLSTTADPYLTPDGPVDLAVCVDKSRRFTFT